MANKVEPISAWQPMQTAPLNGALIMLATSGGFAIGFWEVMWSWKKFRTITTWRAVWGPGEATDPPGTFDTYGWMPIPAMPETQKQL